MSRIPDNIINHLNKIGGCINLVDIGAFTGGFKHENCNAFKDSYWVGVEPNPFIPSAKDHYNLFFNNALDNVQEPCTLDFHVNGDEMCSSLLRMKSELITHNFGERDNKWFVARDIDKVYKTIPVEVISGKHLLDRVEKFQNQDIHFIKIDTQGVDIRVVESMGKYLDKILFIQIESVTSKNKDVVLYEGQVTIKEDQQRMKNLGYKPMCVMDYSSHASPEADVIFCKEHLDFEEVQV